MRASPPGRNLSLRRSPAVLLWVLHAACTFDRSVKDDTAAARADGATDSVDSAATEAFPSCAPYSGFLAAGTRWSYTGLAYSGDFTAEITGWSGREVTRFERREVTDPEHLSWEEGDYTYRCEDDGLYLSSSVTVKSVGYGGTEDDVRLETSYYHPVLIVPAELEPGDSFVQIWAPAIYSSDGSVTTSYWSTGYDVVEEAEIEVGAGTFTALRLQESRTESMWLVEDVGFALSEQWELSAFEE